MQNSIVRVGLCATIIALGATTSRSVSAQEQPPPPADTRSPRTPMVLPPEQFDNWWQEEQKRQARQEREVPPTGSYNLNPSIGFDYNRMSELWSTRLNFQADGESFPNIHRPSADGLYLTGKGRATFEHRSFIPAEPTSPANSDEESGTETNPPKPKRQTILAVGFEEESIGIAGSASQSDDAYSVLGVGGQTSINFQKEYGGKFARVSGGFGFGPGFARAGRPPPPPPQLDDEGNAIPVGEPGPWKPTIYSNRFVFFVGWWYGTAIVSHQLLDGKLIQEQAPILYIRWSPYQSIDSSFVMRGIPRAEGSNPLASPYAEAILNLNYSFSGNANSEADRTSSTSAIPTIGVQARIDTVNAIPVPERTWTTVSINFGIAITPRPPEERVPSTDRGVRP
ncbi:MAG: hypothetical protein V1723_00375 [Candidatus Uhrbacteria bacterium]